jgi:hypothetical protein
VALSEHKQVHTDFLQAARESSPLWLNIFSLLRKSADDDPAECTGASNGLINLMASVISNGVADVSQPGPQRRVSLVKLWADTGFFPALDEVVTNGSLDIQKDDYQLCRWSIPSYFIFHSKRLLKGPCFRRRYCHHPPPRQTCTGSRSISSSSAQSTLSPPTVIYLFIANLEIHQTQRTNANRCTV